MPKRPKPTTKRGIWLREAPAEYRAAFASSGRAASAAKRRELAAGRPPSYKEIAVCLRPDQVAALGQVGEVTHLNRSFLIREAVDHWLARWEEAKREGRRHRAWGSWDKPGKSNK